MRKLVEFAEYLPLESAKLRAFCINPLGYLSAEGFDTSDLPDNVGAIPLADAQAMTAVDDLRRLLDRYRVEPARAPSPQAGKVPSPPVPASALILKDGGSQPLESMTIGGEAEAATVGIGLPFPEFAPALEAKRARVGKRRSAQPEGGRLDLGEAPEPELSPLPDAGQSAQMSLRRIILPEGTGEMTERAVAEAIIAADDRVEVTNTANHPFSWLCRLEITAATGSKWLGTGWFIAPGVIVTAGHCVYIHNHGGWVSSIAVHVGQTGGSVIRSERSNRFATTRGWAEGRDPVHDYGVLFVTPGDQGYFGYGVLKDALIAGALANITGYPQDKPPGTLWGHAKTLRPPGLRSLTYEIDTFGGMSGAPVVMWDGRDYLAIGIHNYGEANANSASRITEDVFHNLERWKSFAAEA